MALIREGVQRKNNGKDGNSLVSRAMRQLAWRDVFINKKFVELNVEQHILRVQQKSKGELEGFGTGLTVWPAACVLLKYLEHAYGSSGMRDMRVVELGSYIIPRKHYGDHNINI